MKPFTTPPLPTRAWNKLIRSLNNVKVNKKLSKRLKAVYEKFKEKGIEL